ncbi:hypothetical protein CSKR_201862 [Clonorchis sinensis]|uniref:Uncharacterized protein n=1 Tax=Clonorchis sinensis TaxID=79923 RepID=A0A8T1MYC1_CLOSI|nr:hypothetical protein CSKR_201862 [Clonorchis sinensis]
MRLPPYLSPEQFCLFILFHFWGKRNDLGCCLNDSDGFLKESKVRYLVDFDMLSFLSSPPSFCYKSIPNATLSLLPPLLLLLLIFRRSSNIGINFCVFQTMPCIMS